MREGSAARRRGGQERIDRLEVDEWKEESPVSRLSLGGKTHFCAKSPVTTGENSQNGRFEAEEFRWKLRLEQERGPK